MADVRTTPEEDGWAEGTLRTILQGDFYKNPTLTGLTIRAVVSAIPYLDQAADVQDTASWVIDCRDKGLEDLEVKIGGLLLGIGWIPTLGSVGKGVLKAANSPAGAKAAVKAIRGMNWLGIGNAYKWMKELASELPSYAKKAAGLMGDVLDELSGLLVKLRPHVPAKVALKVDAWLAMVARIRASIDNMFKEAAEHLKKKLDEALAAFQKEDFAVPSRGTAAVIQESMPPPAKFLGQEIPATATTQATSRRVGRTELDTLLRDGEVKPRGPWADTADARGAQIDSHISSPRANTPAYSITSRTDYGPTTKGGAARVVFKPGVHVYDLENAALHAPDTETARMIINEKELQLVDGYKLDDLEAIIGKDGTPIPIPGR